MFFFEGYTLGRIAVWVGLVVALILLNEITRRNKICAFAMYLVFPIVATVFVWPITGAEEATAGNWFAWVKTYSALAGVLGFMALRYSKRVQGWKWFRYFPFAILAINIAEAISREFEIASTQFGTSVIENGIFLQGGIWNILNGVSGVILIITLTSWAGISIANTKSRDMIWRDMMSFWIVFYFLWNFAYCYNAISTRSMYAGFMILVSCEICTRFFKKGAWLEHRARTLALWAMFSLTFPKYSTMDAFQIVSTNSPVAMTVLSAITLAFGVGVLVFQIKTIFKTKRNFIKEDIYCELKEYAEIKAENNL